MVAVPPSALCSSAPPPSWRRRRPLPRRRRPLHTSRCSVRAAARLDRGSPNKSGRARPWNLGWVWRRCRLDRALGAASSR
ncbi:hypothetical protein SORBI_3003G163301 [Sorghum bicolor]|uniref:Uncharacterized protein n=1 Tax=Sorghum bicolor TaxID=4558 RepID=A0A1W0VXI8_SORBI|nr:hypothetical protein SORBI_3003G163301 [Sorghum bicolor]